MLFFNQTRQTKYKITQLAAHFILLKLLTEEPNAFNGAFYTLVVKSRFLKKYFAENVTKLYTYHRNYLHSITNFKINTA